MNSRNEVRGINVREARREALGEYADSLFKDKEKVRATLKSLHKRLWIIFVGALLEMIFYSTKVLVQTIFFLAPAYFGFNMIISKFRFGWLPSSSLSVWQTMAITLMLVIFISGYKEIKKATK